MSYYTAAFQPSHELWYRKNWATGARKAPPFVPDLLHMTFNGHEIDSESYNFTLNYSLTPTELSAGIDNGEGIIV